MSASASTSSPNFTGRSLESQLGASYGLRGLSSVTSVIRASGPDRAEEPMAKALAATPSSASSRPMTSSSLPWRSAGWLTTATVGPWMSGRVSPAGACALPAIITTALPRAGSSPTSDGNLAPRKPASAPNQDDIVPAACKVPVLGTAPNTIGSSSGRTSRRSKKGCGSSARSFVWATGATVSSSTLSLPTLAHRLECSGSSHSIV
ncbi:hypothetical protein D3C71_1389880 [compost metagenome]